MIAPTLAAEPVTFYAPLTKVQAAYWHKKLSEVVGVQMQQNPEVDAEGRHHTFFTLLDAPQPDPTESAP